GTLSVDFDGSDPSAPFQGAYSPSATVRLQGTRQWMSAVFRLHDARFLNAQNGGADLRLSCGDLALPVASVRLLREGLLGSHPAEHGFQIRLTGIPGATYLIQSSTNLTQWTEVVRLRPATPVSHHLAPLPPPRPWHQWYRGRPESSAAH
ncbi:MAG: hypothetical protein IT580_01975, partial [Verrucomicrobiales bacterium]|nr:hypothetical protein [Verrucomicrobiales bacterium]